MLPVSGPALRPSDDILLAQDPHNSDKWVLTPLSVTIFPRGAAPTPKSGQGHCRMRRKISQLHVLGKWLLTLPASWVMGPMDVSVGQDASQDIIQDACWPPSPVPCVSEHASEHQNQKMELRQHLFYFSASQVGLPQGSAEFMGGWRFIPAKPKIIMDPMMPQLSFS